MKAWRAVVTMAAVLAAGSAGAATDNAREKTGGGGSSSSAGARHHSGGGSSSSGSVERITGSSGAPVSQDHTPTPAQLRHPRAGTGTGHRRGGYGYYNPYYYNPYFYGFYGSGWYSPFYYPSYYGYGPGYGYGYGGYGSHQYGRSSYREGSVRVQVEPSQTRVYVDGYYAGVADDFDGIFQRLNIAPGRHDLSLRLEGYRTRNLKLYVPDDGTVKVQHRMVKGTGEEDAGVVGRPEDYARYDDRDDPRYDDRDDRDDPYRRDDRDPYDDRDGDLRADQAGARALVRLDVRPGDASVYVDGAFRGTGGELRQLRLPAGRHRIEVVRPGYRTVERDVELQPGQAVDVLIDLDRS
jgi:hypothetical protein